MPCRAREAKILADIFVPRSKNPPAKVKDKGIRALVMNGAGAYNAKNGELLFLPAALLEKNRLVSALFAELLRGGGFQPVDCGGSDEAVFSLAERYVREYREKALCWAQEKGREVSLYCWGETSEDVLLKMQCASLAIQGLTGSRAAVNYITDTTISSYKAIKGVLPAEKGSDGAIGAFKCAGCGAEFLPDSECRRQAKPVNADFTEEMLQDVYTPGAHTIPLLCEFLNVPAETTLKAMLYTLELPDGGKKILFAMIRGDRDISISKLAAWVGENCPGAMFRRAGESEIVKEFGEVAGFCGPVGVPGHVLTVADLSLADGKNFVVGGNRPDYHRTGCCWGRDFAPPLADLALYTCETPCANCGGRLRETWFRPVCEFECGESAISKEPVLACRDRDGEHTWAHRFSGKVFLEQIILAMYENKDGGNGND